MKNSEAAEKCYEKSLDFCLDNGQIEKALQNSVKFPRSKGHYKISTSRFGEDEITNFAFGKIAKQYGLFLKDVGFKELVFMLGDNLKNKSAKQVFANGGYEKFLCVDCGRPDVKHGLEETLFPVGGIRKNADYDNIHQKPFDYDGRINNLA